MSRRAYESHRRPEARPISGERRLGGPEDLDELAWQATTTPSYAAPVALAMLADALVAAGEIDAMGELDEAWAWARSITVPLETQIAEREEGAWRSAMVLSRDEILDLGADLGIAITRIRPGFARAMTLRVHGTMLDAPVSGAREALQNALQRRLPPGIFVDIELRAEP